ncbi:Lsr2 family protein [Cellulomonas sp. SLBN-39]|uniref:histone-like nucleoid-structuring protein Lsr2 n=1 Tax=Cellulomonas sp. SLBN-39 TaxID=2768446 RepID=UPI001152537A|nr:Lsr2 family protein [Cellulomonas sp. SLBN-39]TQL02369.1 Lsr2 protein [Cellulomonas sp. SLBN-39]
MAQQTRVIITDDIDGTEGAATYRFAWQDTVYEVDLNDEHRDELLRALQPYIAAGRRAERPGRRAAAATVDRDQSRAVRAWARENGHKITDRGRIPASVLEAYENR